MRGAVSGLSLRHSAVPGGIAAVSIGISTFDGSRTPSPADLTLYDIRCMGATCTLAVNGEVVNTFRTGITKGYVGLESEGYQITFKDFELRELK